LQHNQLSTHLYSKNMGFKELFTESSFAKHHRSVKAAPHEVIWNRSLILSSLLYAMSAVPLSESFTITTRYRLSLSNKSLNSLGSSLCRIRTLSSWFPEAFPVPFRQQRTRDSQLHIYCLCRSRCWRWSVFLSQRQNRSSMEFPTVYLHLDHRTDGCDSIANSGWSLCLSHHLRPGYGCTHCHRTNVHRRDCPR
jgi:hypothetical protein